MRRRRETVGTRSYWEGRPVCVQGPDRSSGRGGWNGQDQALVLQVVQSHGVEMLSSATPFLRGIKSPAHTVFRFVVTEGSIVAMPSDFGERGSQELGMDVGDGRRSRRISRCRGSGHGIAQRRMKG